jgi:phage terminase large subunit
MTAETAQIALPEKLIPVFQGPADVRGAYGGRGSAKTRSFAKMAAVKGYIYGNAGIRGQILCARQFMNSLEDSSLEEVKRAIEEEPWLAAWYDVGEKYIKSKCGRISFAFAGLDRNIASIKSKGRILLCWVDEAEPVTEQAFSTLVPTLREEGDTDGDPWNAELWVTWNPKSKKSAVDLRYRNSKDPLIKVVQLNWRDNPKFPAKLERERQRDLIENPEQYAHIWEGDYVAVVKGAYYAKQLIAAKQGNRIGRVPFDPLMTIRLFVDIGGTGAKADAFAMWPTQFIGKEIRIRDYYEAQGQDLATHLAWCREMGYTPDRAEFVLPHDGATHDKVHAVSYESALIDAGYAVTVIPNQGRGAAKARIEAARRIFPAVWFDEESTQDGRAALGWYHEKRSTDDRNVGLGPEHDWSSHGADAFGLMAIAYEAPDEYEEDDEDIDQTGRSAIGGY